MASDGRPERSEIAGPSDIAMGEARNKRNIVIRCADELHAAQITLAKAVKSIDDLERKIAVLEDELDGYLK
jgi:hypothetical protein